jgi:hypothetical protein
MSITIGERVPRIVVDSYLGGTGEPEWAALTDYHGKSIVEEITP